MMEMFTDDRQRGKMDLNEAMTERHSVRMYTDEPVSKALLSEIASEIERCNAKSGLHFQMAAGLDDAFCGYKTHYGRFSGVHNAIALVAKIGVPYDLHPAKKQARPNTSNAATSSSLNSTSRADQSAASANSRSNDPTPDAHFISQTPGPTANNRHTTDSAEQPIDPVPPEEAETEEKVGYYGEQLALTLVGLGLDCSWAVLDDATDGWWKLEPGERMVWILAFGHGARPGAKHHSKPLDSFCSLPTSLGKNGEAPTLADAPDWFQRGVAAASLAPTSLSQQPFHFTLEDARAAEMTNDKSLNATDPATQVEGSSGQSTANDSPSVTTVNSMASSASPKPRVSACVTPGLFAHVGLGCAKRHFEIGAGTSNFVWA
ncbi:nitroreductase family protein [Bifidobacterium sp. ESL0704]|uniref:nitroreductase family protein n=1 Tax=Bifidobacterium sp. ESL0704 TaxID=2983219 RepID=UPI0023F75C25|nr:nitroreductase family protein [Bifidobacterium sp. ESL0704]WEV52910.1 hypothetical protein OZX64_08680 [Bifidobacterium sp. ESL0704]